MLQNVKPLTDEVSNALNVAFGRYYAYLESFGPDELYLKKKVENELGQKLIHLKMRCSGLGGDWGKVYPLSHCTHTHILLVVSFFSLYIICDASCCLGSRRHVLLTVKNLCKCSNSVFIVFFFIFCEVKEG